MNVKDIQDAMYGAIVARGCFIVSIKISRDNDIELTVESENGVVSMDDCIELSRVFEANFDREKEDYSLTVTSAGLDQPFTVLKQYKKALGKKVEVALKGGRKTVATLEAADEESVTLTYSVLEAVEGSKKKVPVSHTDTFPMNEVNSVRYFIELGDIQK